jgi:molybdate/tungstate transport system permease protein
MKKYNRGNSLYYLFVIFFVIYILFILTPIVRTITFQSFSYIVEDTKSGIWQSISYTYLLALFVGLLAIGFSVPYVYFISRNNNSGIKALDALVELPIMIPHTVVGLMMLITFSPTMPLGRFILSIYPDYQFLDTFLAVIVTLFFLSSAYSIRTVQISYSRDVMKYENIGRTLGLSPFKSYFVIAIPMMKRALLRGLILSWARSISEVGSLLIVAYYILPSFVHLAGVFIYSQFLGGQLPLAVASSSILIFTGLLALLGVKLLERER